MGTNASLIRLIQDLQRHDIFFTEEAEKDLQKLVNTDIENFVKTFLKDFLRIEFDNYNKFEYLKLTKQQRKRIKETKLRRYEYRKTSNLRCIFMVCNNNLDNNITIILCAFNEDGDKKTGKNSYNQNIERAIRIAEGVLIDKDEN